MGITFNIVEQKGLDYEEAKKAYLDGVKGMRFRKMFGIGTSQYKRLLERFREDGIPVHQRGGVYYGTPKYYYCTKEREDYFIVCKWINRKKHYFGFYNSEEEAKARVEELKKNNWNGLLK